MDAEQANASGTGPFLALLKREFREDWLFLLATVALLACRALVPPDMVLRPAALSVNLLAIACGLALGVRAFAPDSANGTARFLAALPVPGNIVLAAKLAVRVLAILAGMVIATGLAANGAVPFPSIAGGRVLFACLVGVLAGQVLDRSATAFAAGAALLVVLPSLKVQWILRSSEHPDFRSMPDLTLVWVVVMSMGAAALLGVSYWLAKRP